MRQIGEAGVWGKRTPEACTNLSWEVRLLREWGGNRSIGKANLRKGRQPLLWLARPVPGRCTLRPTRQTGRFCAMQGVNFFKPAAVGRLSSLEEFSGWELSFSASFSGGRFEPRPTLIFRGFCFPLRGGGRFRIYYVERNRAVALDFDEDFGTAFGEFRVDFFELIRRRYFLSVHR